MNKGTISTAQLCDQEIIMRVFIYIIAIAISTAPAFARYSYSSHPGAEAQIVDREPDRVGFGDTILVNDHTCPVGQIKQVTGGNRNKGVPRQRQCIAH